MRGGTRERTCCKWKGTMKRNIILLSADRKERYLRLHITTQSSLHSLRNSLLNIFSEPTQCLSLVTPTRTQTRTHARTHARTHTYTPQPQHSFLFICINHKGNAKTIFASFQTKCHQYWPSKGSAVYGQFTVKLLVTEELADFEIRTFSIQVVSLQR